MPYYRTEDDSNMQFSFLHISDLHFHTESIDASVFRKKIKDKIDGIRIDPDFVIISGDIFHQGTLSATTFSDIQRYIERLPGTQRYVAPGNHDLDRLARAPIENSYNEYQTRQKIIMDKSKYLPTATGEFSLSEAEKEVLYRGAFGGFHSLLKKIPVVPFASNEQALYASNYEVSIQYAQIKNSPYYVRLVLLNTALIAGQSIRGQEYRCKLADLRKESQTAVDSGDYVKAAEIQLKLAKIQKLFEDHGEVIIDEEMQSAEKCGRMSLSNEGLSILSNIADYDPQKGSNIVVLTTLFVGHHGYDYLSSATQKALGLAMTECQSGIYLCGHAHQPRYKKFDLHPNSAPEVIKQFQAGGLFRDDTGYAQCSFNYGQFTYCPNLAKVEGNICSYFMLNLPSGESEWYRERVACDSRLSLSARFSEKNDALIHPDIQNSNPSTSGPATTGNILK